MVVAVEVRVTPQPPTGVRRKPLKHRSHHPILLRMIVNGGFV